MKIPVSYACAMLSSLSDPDGVKHPDKTILYSIELALNDDGHNFKRKEYKNGLKLLYERMTKQS